MAQNLRDRGYGSSVENYLQQQKKKQTQKGPVSQKKEVYGPPASAAPNKNQQKYHSRQTTAAPGTATVQKGNRVSGRSVGTIGAGKQSAPAPVSTQRISTVGYDRAAPASAGKLSEAEFSRSPAMQKSYGSYDNYTRGVRVTGGGFYHLDAPDFTGMQAAQSQYEQAYETIMGNLAKREKDLETAASMTGTLRPDQEVARGRAVEEYLKAKDAAERISRDYQTMRQENERTQSAFRTENEKWRSTIREMGAVQKEYDQKEQEIQTLQKRQDELRAQSASANTRGQALARNTGTIDAGALEFMMNARDEISRIDRQIQNLREDQALLNEEMEWSRYFRWQGFADQSIPVSAQRANGGMNLLENEADYRARFNQAVEDRSGIRSRAREGVNRLDSDAQMTKYMTADERRIYENLYRQQGPEIAQQYFDELRSMDLNTRRRIREEDALRAAVRDDPVGIGTAGMNLMTVLLKPLQAISFLGQTAEMLTTGKMTKDAAYNRALYMSNAVRGETGAEINEAVSRRFGENWGKWGEAGYQTGMSMLDFLYNTWLTGGFSVDKGALAAYQGGARTAEALAAGRAYKAAEQFGLLLMSSEAAADATMQAKDRGLSDGQAYALGCIAGAAEYVTEKISLENLLDMVNAGGGVKEQIWYALKNRIAEASEEGASDMINLFADILITKDKSEWQTAIRAYQAQGLSENEAFIKALTDQAEQTGMSMAGGWVSGGTMSNVMLGLNAGRNYIQNRDTITGADYVGSIIRQAEGLKEGSTGYQAAQALQARLDAGERPSVREVLNAQKRIDTERRTERKYVRTQIREAERYEGTEAAEQAEVLREKLARGEDASIREINRLEDALDEARATDPETLRPVIAQGMAGDPNGEAYRAAQGLQKKLDAGQRITLKEAASASQTIRTAVEQDLQSRNAEAIGRRLVTEDGQAALAEAADTVAAYGNAEMQTRAAEVREQMHTGEIDARTAGEVFLESERIWNRQQERAANTRVLQPREVTEGMTELERTAAQIGVSEQETARVKAVADLLGADVRYFSEEAERFQRDGRNLIRTKNGYYDKTTGTIWLNAQSTNPVMTVLSHELTHSLETTESYGEFRKLVLPMSGEMRRTIEQTYESQNLAPEDIDHEVVARYVEEHLLTDEAAIRDAVQRNRSFGQWMRDQLDKVLAKLGNEDARERVTLQKARDLYAQALKEKAASRGETDGRLRLPKAEEREAQYSISELPDGRKFVDVDVDQHLFDGLSLSEMRKLARAEILRRFRGNIIGGKNAAYVNKESAKHYAYPANRRVAPNVMSDKMRAAPELDNILEASVYRGNEPDNGRHPKATGGWNKYDTLFRVGGKLYTGEISVMVTDDGPVFHDLTKMKEDTTGRVNGQTQNRAAASTDDVSNEILSQQEPEVKGLSLPKAEDGKQQFSMSEEVEQVGSLVALHNLSEDKLEKALRLGGFPMPSIAVTKTNIPHTNFGDITLVMNRSTIDPQADRRNKTYSADAWTPTFPEIEYEANGSVTRKIRSRYYDLYNQYGREATDPLYAWANYPDDELKRRGGEAGVLRAAKENTDMMRLFLLDTQQKAVENVVDETVERLPQNLIEHYDRMAELMGRDAFEELRAEPGQNPREARKAWWDKYGERYEAARRQELLERGLDEETIDAYLENETVAAHTRHALAIRNYLNNGPEKRTQSVNREKTDAAIRQQVDPDEYEAWLHGLFDGIEKSQGVYNGRDYYTPSGDRRSFAQTHFPVTLENIARAMARQNEGKTKNVSGFHGVKSLRANTALEFSSIDEMHENEGRLQHLSQEEADQITERYQKELLELIYEIYNTRPHNSYENQFIETDHIGEMLSEAAENGARTAADVQRAFQGSGYRVDAQTGRAILRLFRGISEMPVNIFEAKPARAVRFDEVMAAIVPKGTSPELVQQLREAGVQDIREYEKDNTQDRIAKVNSVPDAAFSITEEEEGPRGLRLPKVEDEADGRMRASAPTESEVDAAAEEQTKKKAKKPVAESRPIEARRWLNRQTVDKFGIPEGKRKAAAFVRGRGGRGAGRLLQDHAGDRDRRKNPRAGIRQGGLRRRLERLPETRVCRRPDADEYQSDGKQQGHGHRHDLARAERNVAGSVPGGRVRSEGAA